MRIDWWTLGLQAVNALVLVWLLSRFLFRPIANILAERQAAVRKIVAEAEAAKAAAQAEKSKAEAETEELAAGREDALKAATADAEKQKAALLSAARAEADRLREEARAGIARDRAAADQAASERAERLAVDIAARLLGRLPDEDRISGFIDGLAEGVGSLPEDVRAGLGTDGTPLAVTAAQALTDRERTACREALRKVLSREVDIDVKVDPGLIAGLELHAPHAEVRNSFRADLERIRTDLGRHDEN